MTEVQLRELIKDKDKFISYVTGTMFKENARTKLGIPEKAYTDVLGREVLWELDNRYISRQYRIYPSKESNHCVIYFTRDNYIAFIDQNDEDCTEEDFFKLFNV